MGEHINPELITYFNDPQIQHFAGDIGVVYIHSHSPQRFLYAADLEQQIDAAWLVFEQSAAANHQPLHNGAIPRFQDHHITLDKKMIVGLDIALTDYKHIRIGRDMELPRRAFAISTAAVCYFYDGTTGERNYLFGQRNQGTGLWQALPAGYLDCSLFPVDIGSTVGIATGIQTNTVFTLNILKEFGEEVGIAVEKIKTVQLLGIFTIADYIWKTTEESTKNRKVTHYYDFVINYAIELAATADDVTACLRKKVQPHKNKQREHNDFALVKQSELYSFLQHHTVVPHTKAALYQFFK